MNSSASLFLLAAAQFLDASADPAARSFLDTELEALALKVDADEEVDRALERLANHPAINALRAALDRTSERWVSRAGGERYEGVLLTIPITVKSAASSGHLSARDVSELAERMHEHRMVPPAAQVVIQPWISTVDDLIANHARRKRMLIGMMADALRGPGILPYQDSLRIVPEPASAPTSALRFLTLSVQGYGDCQALPSRWGTETGAPTMLHWLTDLAATLKRSGWELQSTGSPCFYSDAPVKGDLLNALQNVRLFCQIAKLTHAKIAPEACTLRVTRVWPQPADSLKFRLEYRHDGETLHAQGLTLKRASILAAAGDSEHRLRHLAALAAGNAGIGKFEPIGFD